MSQDSVTPALDRSYDRIAVCQHPNGEGFYVPADHIVDGRCFQDCDCTPRIYVAEDTL